MSNSSGFLAPSESDMWRGAATRGKPEMTDEEINAKYTRREWRIVTESNREQLPNFVEALKRPGWMDVRPFYQRRQRWDAQRQSKLIESFIMNIPVPPLFVYEADLAKYEVMDGQQRISAIQDFYSNNFALTGLEQWPELEGRTYSKLPSEIKKGIDRRSISYTVLLKESAETTEEQALLRQLVFERLNTGGVKLNNQEIRNCLYQGKFNSMLLELAKNEDYRAAWNLPKYSDYENSNPSTTLLNNNFYSKMTDVEVILRFFALRHVTMYQRGMQGFLDLFMVRSKSFKESDLELLKETFTQTISLGREIFGATLFRPYDIKTEDWAKNPQVAYADAVMVGLWRNLSDAKVLREKKEDVIKQTMEMFRLSEEGTFTGRANTKADVSDRIDRFDRMLNNVVTGPS